MYSFLTSELGGSDWLHASAALTRREGAVVTHGMSGQMSTRADLDTSEKRGISFPDGNYFKSQRLSWFGHTNRMPEFSIVKKIYKWQPFTNRPVGRPKCRWEDDFKNDLKKLKVRPVPRST